MHDEPAVTTAKRRGINLFSAVGGLQGLQSGEWHTVLAPSWGVV